MRKVIWLGTGVAALATLLAAQCVYAASPEGTTKKHSSRVTQGEGAAAPGDAKAPKKKHSRRHKSHKAGTPNAGAPAGVK